MRQTDFVAFSGVNAASNQNSSPMDSSSVTALSVQAVSTGTAAGTLQVQVSNDPPGVTPTNWSNLSGASVSISGAAVYLIPFVNIAYQWVRLSYTASSGTGTLSASIKTDGV
jgi:hypothetical protein